MNYRFASTYSLIIIMFLLALFLFLRFEKRNRARLFLGSAFLLFGILMLFQFMHAYVWNNLEQVDFTLSTLFTTAFICTTSLAYHYEIRSPMSVTLSKILKFNLPVIGLFGGCLVLYLNGYRFLYYSSFIDLFSSITRFDAITSVLLLMFIGGCITYTIKLLLTLNDEEVHSDWSFRYLIAFIVMNLFYLLSIISNDGLHMICKYTFVLCCAYITYLELFERASLELVQTNITEASLVLKGYEVRSSRIKGLRIRLTEYMEQEKAWRDPDITVKDVTTKLRTNRRALNSVVQEMGYDNFPSYINYLRVKDFTEIIENSKDDSFQNIFFNVGFKSRATAHRNFKNIKGLSPSEYYLSIQDESRT